MFGLYLIGAVLSFAIGVFILGRKQAAWEAARDKNNNRGYGTEPFELMWPLGAAAIGWPLLLAVACILGPFVGLFYLGFKTAKNK